MDIEDGSVEDGERMTVGVGIAEDGTESEDASRMLTLLYLNPPCIWTSELREWYIVVSWCTYSEASTLLWDRVFVRDAIVHVYSWNKIEFSFENRRGPLFR